MRWGISIALGALLLAAPVSVLAEDWEIREVTHTFTARAGTEGFAKDGEAITLPEGAAIYQKNGAMMLPAEPFLKSLGDDISLEWDKFNEGILYAFWGDAQLAFDVNKKEVNGGRLDHFIVLYMEQRGSQLFLPLRDWAEILPEFYCKAKDISWDAETRTATLRYAAEELETGGDVPLPTGEGAMPEYILQPTQEYDMIQNLGGGYFSAETGYPNKKMFILGSNGEILQSYDGRTSIGYAGEDRFQIREYAPKKDASYITDQNGKIIFQTEPKNDIRFSEGLAQTAIKSGEVFPSAKGNIDWNIGFLDADGNLAISTGYYFAEDFSEGLAAVATVEEETAQQWWGYIDKKGTLVIDAEYVSCGSFHEGLAYARSDDRLNGEYGYIDKTGREIIPPQYDWASDFYNGTAFVLEGRGTEDGKLWVIDRTGKKLKLLAETAAVYEPSAWSGVAATATTHTAMFHGKPVSFATYYNADGKLLYAESVWLQNASEGLMPLQDAETGKWGYVDHDWHWAIAPVFDHADNFQDGYAVVYQETKQGDVTIDSAWGIIKKP